MGGASKTNLQQPIFDLHLEQLMTLQNVRYRTQVVMATQYIGQTGKNWLRSKGQAFSAIQKNI